MQLLEGRERVSESEREREREKCPFGIQSIAQRNGASHISRKVMFRASGAAPSFQRAADHDSDQFAGLFLAAFWLLTAANRGTHLNFRHFT